jgi:hypothetical protein
MKFEYQHGRGPAGSTAWTMRRLNLRDLTGWHAGVGSMAEVAGSPGVTRVASRAPISWSDRSQVG